MSKNLRALVCACAATLFGVLGAGVQAQQVADASFRPAIPKPTYAQGLGPLVLIDEAHFNFHTASGRYQAFAELLRRDGYNVQPSTVPFSREALKKARILVIANALAERNGSGDWSLPTPSAFTDEEIAAVREWVRRGGSLLLIADHMPFPGAAEKLAAAFGIEFNNGFALDETRQGGGPLIFRQSDGSLKDSPITRGRSADEKVSEVATFTGSAFKAGQDARPLLVFRPAIVSLMPSVAWQFKPDTPRVPVEGWLQGATLRYGKGRVAVFGEAAMFTAQLAGPDRTPIGMNSPAAPQNARFLLNILQWLSGKLGK
ncbi:MAG: DUF4350 domain-containing protein [Pyrinomonadaceae bacterium]|nr:DUF4350 domain-containing protein [Pyrinomonadaceae bacterium]